MCVLDEMSELAIQHQKEMDKFLAEQEHNQQRVNKGLQEKLNARRTRRARARLESQQLNMLQAGGTAPLPEVDS